MLSPGTTPPSEDRTFPTPNEVDAVTVGAPPTNAQVGPTLASRPLLGLALMIGGMIILPMQDGLAKALSQSTSVAVVVWARYVFQLAFLVPLIALRFSSWRDLRVRRPGYQLLRGGLMLASAMAFFTALARMPLVDTLALFFVSPLVVTALAPVWLRERVGWQRGAAVIVGFVGVLILLRPGTAVFEPVALLALASGAIHGAYLIVTRKLAGTAPPLVTIGYSAIIGGAAMSVWVLPSWTPPEPQQVGLMVALGAAAAVGQYLVAKAFDYAPAAWLAPVGFAEIVTATVVGFAFFGDLPDMVAWVGVAIVVGSGLYISVVERVESNTAS